jgi:tripartite-type tricarboxylate transporter receptor subunit TctC
MGLEYPARQYRLPLISGMLFAATLSAAAIAPHAVMAQTYPNQPIRIIVPAAAGGAFDVAGRFLATEMGKSLPQQVLVENRAGAASMLGAEAVATSPPDGYRICLCTSGALTISGLVGPKPNYDPIEDLAPVSLSFWLTLVLVTRSDMPANNMKELLAYTKANPGKVTMGYGGGGGLLATALLKSQVGLDVREVPYGGEAPALNDIAAGRIDLFPASVGALAPLMEGGKLKILGPITSQRAGKWPTIPTVAEQGFPGFAVDTFLGLNVPKGTSPDIIKKLQDLAMSAAKTPELRSKLDDLGLVPDGTTAEAYGKIIRAERAQWTKLVNDLGIKPPPQ